MRKTLTAISAAAALAVATVAVPTPASAHVWWFWPAIIGGAVVGTGAVIAASQPYASAGYGGTVTVQPTCHLERRVINGVWQQVRVCP